LLMLNRVHNTKTCLTLETVFRAIDEKTLGFRVLFREARL